MHRALPLTAVLAASLALAACGGDDEQQASTAPTRSETEAETSSTGAPSGEVETQATAPREFAGSTADTEREDGSPAPATGRKARRACLRGDYVSSSFKGRRSFDSPFGKIALSGRGRGLGLSFEGSRWIFRGAGTRPMHGRALGIKGTLKVNGSARGRLVATPGGGVRFRKGGTSGTVTLAGLGVKFELPVSTVAAAIVPDGPAKVSCGGGRLKIDSRSGVLRMTRPG